MASVDSLFRNKRALLAQQRSFWPTSVLSLLLFLVIGCTSDGLQRPYGYMRLGKVVDFPSGETYLPDLRLVVRRDDRGFSVMSTDCTVDLSPLTRKEGERGVTWISSYTTSSYTSAGEVLSGPSKRRLPHYNLKVSSGVYGGPLDTLYVEVGVERDAAWRLELAPK